MFQLIVNYILREIPNFEFLTYVLFHVFVREYDKLYGTT